MEKTNFKETFNLDKEICRFGITTPLDISLLYTQYRKCCEELETIDWIDRKLFHECASVSLLSEMKYQYKLFVEGIAVDLASEWHKSHATIFANAQTYVSAINGKVYKESEYYLAISEYNHKRGLMLTRLNYDGDLSAADIESICSGIKSYAVDELINVNTIGKIKLELNGDVILEEPNAESI